MNIKPNSDMFLLLLLLAMVCAFVFRGHMISESSVIEAIKNKGYTKPVITHTYIFASGWSCENSAVSFKGTAEYVIGKRVNIVACADWPTEQVTVHIQ